MAKDLYSSNVNVFTSKLHTDTDPTSQPKGSHRFGLNVVNQTPDGKYGSLSNEPSNYASTPIANGFSPIGDKYIGDDTVAVIMVNPESGKEQIGLINKNHVYTPIVDTLVLNLDIRHQCQIEYRLRRGNEKVIYWVDAKNRARTFNFSKPYDFYNATYGAYLRAGGNPTIFIGEKWDASSFDLVKSYSSIPFFSNIQILETGSILAGSYNFSIQYIDQDLNPTEWITTTNTVNIFNDSVSNPFGRIRGSRATSSMGQNFDRAQKSIKLFISNLDKNYPFYRIAIIQAAGGLSSVTKVYASELYSTSENNFIYTGNDKELTEISLGDILIEKEVIFAPHHISQLENRLELAHTKGKNLPYCDFQSYASKITSDLATKEVILNDVTSLPNVKNPNSTFLYRGYMPGDVYSFGIMYLFTDGSISPVFHIPGRNISNSTSQMLYHEIDNKYLDVHNCVSNNYWGQDSTGTNLLGQKQRHHRFPFRKNVNKPLVTTVGGNFTTIKYKLSVVISLNPAFTPAPIYPADSGVPKLINYTFNYKILAESLDSSYSGVLTIDQVNSLSSIVIYDDVNPLEFITGSVYAELDSASELATYQDGVNDQFLISINYISYPVVTPNSSDRNDIFGIQFSNIQKPHPDVVGFYIVRNENMEDDRIVTDTGIFGITTKFQQYVSFGLLSPKQFYPTNSCPRAAHNHAQTLQYDNKTMWFFNPEYHFFQNKPDFDKIEVEGVYEEASKNMPTDCNGLGGDGFSSKGVYISDVQAGSSYNPEIHSQRDNDGFDMIIGYRNLNMSYRTDAVLTLPIKDKIMRMNAASYQNYNNLTYYNVSVDNRISMFVGKTTFDTNIFYNAGTKKNNLVYAAMTKANSSSYSNFITRNYYKEHNNPIYFGANNVINNIDIFNGDVQTSAISLVSSVFYDIVVADRDKKSSIWQIIVGAILIVAGIFTAGLASAAGVAVLTGLAISYGVSLIVSGIKFEQFKNMVQVDYEKGLRETVYDGGVHECIGQDVGKYDDTIRWFADRVSNLYMETRVPMGLRVGLTFGSSDFIDSPAQYDELAFKSYLTEKLTTVDREQTGGRLYKGFAASEFYDANKDYIRFNKEKNYIHLPIEYDCCSSDNEIFPIRVWYSEQSFQEELTDNYRFFLPNNYKDIEGEHGEITNLYRLGNNLFIHTREALWQLPQNVQERTTGEIVSFIGTGDFFSFPPKKILDDNLGSGGTTHKWGTLKTPQGVIFISEIQNKIWLHTGKLEELSKGNREWFEENLKSFLGTQLYIKGIDFINDNNPANPSGIGYMSVYDSRFNRAIITKKDYLLLQEKLDILIIVNIIPVSGTDFVYCTLNGNFYDGTTKIELNNIDYFENKSFTISFSFHTMSWVSWHSYLPNYYIYTQNSFYAFLSGLSMIWKHHRVGHYQTFFGTYYPHIIEYVQLTNPIVTKETEDLVLQTEAREYDFVLKDYIEKRHITFNKIMVYNHRQNSGELAMKVKEIQANPENWYLQQVVNVAGSIVISRRGRDWGINDIRDYIIDPDVAMFTKNWNDIKSSYFIDKKINSTAVSYTKNWYELESFKDKYMVIRLIFDNFDNVNLITNYTVQTEQPTQD